MSFTPSQWLRRASFPTPLSDFAAFIVTQPLSTSTGYAGLWELDQGTVGTNDYTSTNAAFVSLTPSAQQEVYYGSSCCTYNSVGVYKKTALSINVASKTMSAYRTGNSFGGVTRGSVGTGVGIALNQRLQGTWGQGAYQYVYEVLQYSTSLSTADRQLVEGYLAWKWGLTADLPASHPYKVNPPP